MSLPKIQSPIHHIKLPVLNRNVKYRPFTVKEEKILLMAAESNESSDTYSAFLQVVNNCLLEDDIDASKLHIFDLEILFLMLRAASVGEVSEFRVRDAATERWVDISLNLKDVINQSIAEAKIPSKQIQVTDEIGFVMKDITLDIFGGPDMTGVMTAERALVIKLIEKVYDKEELYILSDYSKAEATEFLESFASEDLQKVFGYLHSIPRVRTTVKYRVGGEDRELQLEGISDFFQSV
jgi:hypothetical protein